MKPTTKIFLPIIGILYITPLPSLAQVPYLTEWQKDGWADLDTIPQYSKHDLPGLYGPKEGYMLTHSARWPGRPDYFVQTFTFAPFKTFTPLSGDGGQLVYVTGNSDVVGVETRDGGKPRNQYFAPGGCGYRGWLFFNNNNIAQDQGRWTEQLTTLVDVPEPEGNCPTPGVVATRFRRETGTLMYFIINGTPIWKTVSATIADHFDNTTIATSKTMERGYFVWGYGWTRWEAWTTNLSAPQASDLMSRCPGVYIQNGGPWPMGQPAPGWKITDCRQWTNILFDGDGKTTIRQKSWNPLID